MNISVTNECNRRCDFCFQKEWYLSNDKIPKQEMTLENIDKILKWASNIKRIKVFGGEPLLYSNLQGLFDVFKKNGRKIRFLTNFNVSSEKIDIFFKNKETIDGMLVNCDYNDLQKEQFEENISRIPKDFHLKIGTTLLPDKTYIDKSINRILNTIKILNRKTVRVRVAPMTPNHKIKYDYTHDSGKDVVYFMDKILEIYPTTLFGFDCAINECEVNHETIKLFMTKYKEKINFSTICCYKTNPPLDILVDNSAVWCSSSKFVKVDNIFNYKEPKILIDILKEKYNKYMQENFYKTKCCECPNFNTTCSGLCISKLVNKI